MQIIKLEFYLLSANDYAYIKGVKGEECIE
jgi:hypothetical protein